MGRLAKGFISAPGSRFTVGTGKELAPLAVLRVYRGRFPGKKKELQFYSSSLIGLWFILHKRILGMRLLRVLVLGAFNWDQSNNNLRRLHVPLRAWKKVEKAGFGDAI